jgi:hypothetical protein
VSQLTCTTPSTIILKQTRVSIRFAFASAFGLVFVGKRGLPLYPHLVVFTPLSLRLLSLVFNIFTEDLQEIGQKIGVSSRLCFILSGVIVLPHLWLSILAAFCNIPPHPAPSRRLMYQTMYAIRHYFHVSQPTSFTAPFFRRQHHVPTTPAITLRYYYYTPI